MTVCRGTTTLQREHFATWQSNGRSQARSARKAPATTCVFLLSRKRAASSENRFSASFYRNLRTSTNTETGAECIRTGLLTPGRRNDAPASNFGSRTLAEKTQITDAVPSSCLSRHVGPSIFHVDFCFFSMIPSVHPNVDTLLPVRSG